MANRLVDWNSLAEIVQEIGRVTGELDRTTRATEDRLMAHVASEIDALRKLVDAQGKHIAAQDKKIATLTRIAARQEAHNVVDLKRNIA
jgi:hypothetical protein